MAHSGAFTIQFGDGGRRISISALKDSLAHTITLLETISRDFAPAGVELQWEVIAASLRSPLKMAFAPRPGELNGEAVEIGKQVSDACFRGMRQLAKKPDLPPHFDEEALEAATELALAGRKDDLTVSVAVDRKRCVQLTPQAVDNIRQVMQGTRRYIDFGTIEGKLDTVSVRGGPNIVIWEVLTNYRVVCAIAPEMLAEILDNAKTFLGARVAVTGRITYANDRPKSIQVEKFRRLRTVDELPQFEAIPPIDITGGIPSEEYVRKMRDAQ